MKRTSVAVICTAIICLFALAPALAQEPPMPIPISSEQAFDAVVLQQDPLTGAPRSVVMVDARTRAEFYWVGTTCMAPEIELVNGSVRTPDMGKVQVVAGGMLLMFEENGWRRFVRTRDVASVTLTPIAISIPYLLWNEDTASNEPNGPEFENFVREVEALAETYDTVIFFCRSGGRSQNCLANFDTTLFDEIYEIDQPDGKSGRGGFEGTTYGNAYNGYRGYPGRKTFFQPHESVAWKDLGLPIKIGVNPLQ